MAYHEHFITIETGLSHDPIVKVFHTRMEQIRRVISALTEDYGEWSMTQAMNKAGEDTGTYLVNDKGDDETIRWYME